jgi:hypothetical protein
MWQAEQSACRLATEYMALYPRRQNSSEYFAAWNCKYDIIIIIISSSSSSSSSSCCCDGGGIFFLKELSSESPLVIRVKLNDK